MTSFFLSVWAWMLANPALVWPIATASISWLYTRAAGCPRLHAFFSLIAALGIDLPRVLDALHRLFYGSVPPNIPPPPSSPPMVASKSTLFPMSQEDAKMQPRKREMDLALCRHGFVRIELAILALFTAALGYILGGVVSIQGCSRLPASIVPAVTLAECVLDDVMVKKVTSIATIATDCGADIPSVISAIFGSTAQGIETTAPYAEAIRVRALFRMDGGL